MKAGVDWVKMVYEASTRFRATGFNKVAVDKFHTLFGDVYDKLNIEVR